MRHYQARVRIFEIPGRTEPTFPAEVTIRAHFEPVRAFGREPHSNLVAPGMPAKLEADLVTGRVWATPDVPWTTLCWHAEAAGQRMAFEGNTASLSHRCGSIDDVETLTQQLVSSLPPVLSTVLGVPVVVARVDGLIGATPFRWVYCDATGVVQQHEPASWDKIIPGVWSQLPVIVAPEHRRIAAALGYFHTAMRLREVGISPWEFMGEIILNWAKMLEALFCTQKEWHDDARRGLSRLGFNDEDVEQKFLPALKLRSALDSAHVSLSALAPEELRAVHDYSDAAVKAFKELASRLVVLGVKARAHVVPHVERSPDRTLRGTLERLARWYPGKAGRRGRYLFTGLGEN